MLRRRFTLTVQINISQDKKREKSKIINYNSENLNLQREISNGTYLLFLRNILTHLAYYGYLTASLSKINYFNYQFKLDIHTYVKN
jgi:hypothetical protein